MTAPNEEREIVYVEQDAGSTLKPFLLGLVVGAVVGFLFAPASGAETRHKLKRKAREARDLAEDVVDELRERVAEPGRMMRDIAGGAVSAREELEQRLAEARARRRARSGTAAPPAEPKA
ncbi:MAG TPA: YtxH domain-containing protein [Gemmatimonadales bacterium]|jgi:gas vesicle protein|nr:YtxH domain-containing protein [Gemmatimonadales bacterium]